MTSLLLLNDPAFKVYAVCAVIVVLKMYMVGFYTGVVRRRVGVTTIREDVRQGTQLAEVEHPEVQRVHRVHRNDLENIPAFLALGLIAVLAGVSPLGAEICFVLFTAARVTHTLAFLNAKQPWRSISFGLGVLANMALMVMILIRVFS